MTRDQLVPIWLLLGVAALFAVLIPLLVVLRKRALAANREIRGGDVFALFESGQWEIADLLYGVWQDFSPTDRGMIVRDGSDREVGRIHYRTGRRQGWVAITTGEASFEADVVPTIVHQTVTLHASGEPRRELCRFTSLAGGGLRFEAEGIGVLESPRGEGMVAPLYRYSLDGVVVGVSRHIGQALDRGRALILPRRLPPSLRLFILAMQGERM